MKKLCAICFMYVTNLIVANTEDIAQSGFQGYSRQEFGEYLATLALTNHLVIIRLSNQDEREIPLKQYIASVFMIWSSNRDLDHPLLNKDAVDGILRALKIRLAEEEKPDYLDDPLSLLQSDPEEIRSAFSNVIYPSHIEKFYRKNLDRSVYNQNIEAFREAVNGVEK